MIQFHQFKDRIENTGMKSRSETVYPAKPLPALENPVFKTPKIWITSEENKRSL